MSGPTWWVEEPCAAFPQARRVLRRWVLTREGWDYDDIVNPSDALVARLTQDVAPNPAPSYIT